MHYFKLESIRRSHFSRKTQFRRYSTRPMKSSKLFPQQMAEWDEVGGSSGTIPPHCVPIKSLGGTCTGESELDLGTPQSQYVWLLRYAVCEYSFIDGGSCAATTEFVYLSIELDCADILNFERAPGCRAEGNRWRWRRVGTLWSRGHGDEVLLICLLPFLVPRV